MSMFQILNCSSVLGTCCNDYGLVSILDIIRKFFDILQIVVPILLIIWSGVEFVKLIGNPEEKKALKQLINKYIAAVICFFVPVFVNVVLGIMPESYSVSACWEQAKISTEMTRTLKNSYISTTDQKLSKIIPDQSEYKKGVKNAASSGGGSGLSNIGAGEGSSTGRAIVQYAKSFVGQRYLWGGSWNGELPYTPTDCSGFVSGVFRHFGISLPRTSQGMWDSRSNFTLVTDGNIRAGDIIMYSGHVGILTGNGNEIVHAKGRKWGIVVDSDYKSCSSHSIRGIGRVKGVN